MLFLPPSEQRETLKAISVVSSVSTVQNNVKICFTNLKDTFLSLSVFVTVLCTTTQQQANSSNGL